MKIFCTVGGFIAVGSWLFHILDMGSDVYYVANADIRKPGIRDGCIACICLPLLACCICPFDKETAFMLFCNCFILSDKFKKEKKEDK